MSVGEFDLLYARLDDLRACADRGELGISDFLSPREAHFAKRYLGGFGTRCILWGGYDGAERCRVYVLPDYADGVTCADELEGYGFDTDIAAVRISTAGYRVLSHRDFLGCLLGLGVERAVLGDILVYGEDGASAVALCKSAMAEFFAGELVKIASEKAKTVRVPLGEIEIPERQYATVSDTVASPRLDCVVGAICSLSREKARVAVTSGLVELDFEIEERPDRTVSAPCLVSVRGYGRFRVTSLCDKTRKGRYRLLAEKFI